MFRNFRNVDLVIRPLNKKLFPSAFSLKGKFKSTISYDPYTINGADTNPYNIGRLPLPKPEETINRFLKTIEPLADKKDVDETRELAQDFLKSQDSLKVQNYLKGLSESSNYGSYIEKYWFEMYYGGRWPLMIHVNPFYQFSDEKLISEMCQIKRAAKFSRSMARFWNKFTSGNLEPDVDKRGNFHCSSGFAHMFGLKRIPGLKTDSFQINLESKHVICISNHQYFQIDVIEADGSVKDEQTLERIFSCIKEESNKIVCTSPDIGIITSGDRTAYMKIRTAIGSVSEINRQSFDSLDNCLFVVVLDQLSTTDRNSESKNLLHGIDGTNRYFDKHQLIINENGTAGMCFEHGASDAMTWNRMLHEVWHDMRKVDSGFSSLDLYNRSSSAPDVNTAFKQLEFVLTPETETLIEEASLSAKKEIENVDTHVLEFDHFGKENIKKKWKLSPDAAVQMAFQVAYMNLHRQVAPTYEACAMKHFFHGRTETIRSLTKESKLLGEIFASSISSNDQKREALRNACQMHTQIANGAKVCSGEFMGVDRHLYAMKCAFADLNLPVHPFFQQSKTYEKSSTWMLSTSNVATPLCELFGFGPVAADGYGLGYMTQKHTLPVNITCFKSSGNHAQKYGKELEKVLYQDFDMLFSKE